MIQFNDTSTKNGLIQECESALFGSDYGAISGNTVKLDTFTRYINSGLTELVSEIQEADTRWQFHDSNYTTHPIGTTTLVDGQQDYALDDTHHKILRVEARDSDGNYHVLEPFDTYDIAKHGVAPTEFQKTDGMPAYYDKLGNSIFLYPAPATASVTTSEGLKVAYQGDPSYFTNSDTTKTAGVPFKFQSYPAIFAAHAYCVDNDMDSKAGGFEKKLEKMREQIAEHYNKRDKDEKPQLRVRRRNYA